MSEDDTPTDVQAAQAPAESEQSQQTEQTEKAATSDETGQESQAKTGDESAEQEAGETEGDDKPKRRSGYDRMKRRAAIAEAALADLQRQQANPVNPGDEPKPPKEEDYNGDYFRYMADVAAFNAAKAVEDKLSARERREQESKAQQSQQEVISDFEERADAVRAKVKDFDEVLNAFGSAGGQFSQAVKELVLDSDVGPEMAYFLAKNPAQAKRLNGLSPLSAAKEFGKLETSLSRSPAKTTKAPTPIKPAAGGATPPSDLASLAQADNADAYIRARQASMKR